MKKGSVLVASIRHDCSGTNVTTSAWVVPTLLNTSGSAITSNYIPTQISGIQVISNVAGPFRIGLGASGSEKDIFAGGASQFCNVEDIVIPGGQIISLRSIAANITTGFIIINLYA